MNQALVVKNLTKKYKDFTLDNINFTLPSGCIMGFIGENGAGKSTTIKLILDLIKKDGGNISIMGTSLSHNKVQMREHIGVVMDESSFHDTLNLKDINLIMKNSYTTWNEDAFKKYSNIFSLPAKKMVKDYSRGMKMKLSIACALSHDSKLLILDEATSGLDPIIRDEILDVFLEFIQDETHSIFISSHIISDLEKICDYITFIHKGHIVFSEAKDDLYEKYAIVHCTNEEYEKLNKSNNIIGCRKNQFGVDALVLKNILKPGMTVDNAGIEDIMLYIVKEKAS